MQVIDDAGIHDAVLAGAANAANAHLRVLVTLLDDLFGLPHRLAPQVGRIAQFDLVVFNRQVDRLG